MIKSVLLLVSVFVLASTVQSWKLTNTIVTDSDIAYIGKKSCPPCVCGRTNLPRITGGSDVKYVNKYPWMAKLRVNERFYCGGSLINSKYVLTAAHCVYLYDKENITIRLLEHDRSIETESKIITRKVDHYIIHSNYKEAIYDNDIALIKMDQEVELGIGVEYPSPVCLPQEGTPHNGVDAIVIGWGHTQENVSSLSHVLQEVTIPIIPNDECIRIYNPFDLVITPNMLCSGDTKSGKDSCKGDSGGPLMVSTNLKHHIIGIVSWGYGCGRYPGVYTKVKQYLNWISKNTADACPCFPH